MTVHAERRRSVTRRSLLVGAMTALAAAPALGACSFERTSSGKRQVFVRSPGGAREKVNKQFVWPEFTRQTGIEVVPVTANASKILAMARTGVADVDVIDAGALNIELLQRRQVVERLDLNRFKHTDPRDLEALTDYWAAVSINTDVLVYNTKTFPGAHPSSWSDFWDWRRWPAQRILADAASERPPLEQALIADGVAADRLYPLDINRAFRKMAEIKPYILKFWSSGAEAESMFSSGQATLGQGWSSRMNVLIAGGAPIHIVWNQVVDSYTALAVIKGTPRLDLAYEYIDFVLQPEMNAALAENYLVPPGNKKVYERLTDPSILSKFSTYEPNRSGAVRLDPNWWGENMGKVLTRWQEFLLA